MPKAEVGSTKWLGNKMKAKGLQRLRWYCQVCERQMRDANGFKQHTLSEGHVRQMQVVGQDANKYINDYSNQFKNDFVGLLRTSHGEKKININHFYQEYIANKEHVHMNATKWPSLTEFAKFLGREGVCRVEEGEHGLEISWVDTSPEALRRQAAIRKRERQDKGDEMREQQLIDEQVQRAQQTASLREANDGKELDEGSHGLHRTGMERISLNINARSALTEPSTHHLGHSNGSVPYNDTDAPESVRPEATSERRPEAKEEQQPPKGEKLQMSFGASTKPKNVFAMSSKKVNLAGSKSQRPIQARPMSEAERIMREELDKKRRREDRGLDQVTNKRTRT